MRTLAATVATAADGGSPSSPAALVIAVAGALIAAVLLSEALAAVLRSAGRRSWFWADLARRTRLPGLLLLALVGVQLAVHGTHRESVGFDRACAVGAVLVVAWLVGAAGSAAVTTALGRHLTDAPGRREARGSRALAAAARGVVLAVVLVGGVGGVLLVLPATRVAGVVVLALAVLALATLIGAAAPWLRDLAAGVELAASDALRLDDVLCVDGEWGRVEEITPTGVVLQAWDDRRLVLPARRLAAQGFENWTRRSADLVGTVDLDIEPTVPVAEVRAALLAAVVGNDLWDRRVAVLQVVDATGGRVRVRAVVSAADVPQLADLRCDVREALVDHLARVRPGRADDAAAANKGPGRHSGDTTMTVDPRKDSRLFTGSLFAVERSQAFTGPGPGALAERDARA